VDHHLAQLTRRAALDPSQRGRMRRALDRSGRDATEQVLASWRREGRLLGGEQLGFERVVAGHAELLRRGQHLDDEAGAQLDAALEGELAALPSPSKQVSDPPQLGWKSGGVLSTAPQAQVVAALLRERLPRRSEAFRLLRSRLEDVRCDDVAARLLFRSSSAGVLLYSPEAWTWWGPNLVGDLELRADAFAVLTLLPIGRGPELWPKPHRFEAHMALRRLARDRGLSVEGSVWLDELAEEAAFDLFDERGRWVVRVDGVSVCVGLDGRGRPRFLSRRGRPVQRLKEAISGGSGDRHRLQLRAGRIVALLERAQVEASRILERARSAGRVWTADRFLRTWATNPLLSRVARGTLFRRRADGVSFQLSVHGLVDQAEQPLADWTAWRDGVELA
jgi:hypothetical protein